METTIGKRIAALRKRQGMTQEELAQRLDLSAQAVSKWENDISCPDILLLPQLAALLETTTDQLLSAAPLPETVLLPQEQRKNLKDMMLKIVVNSSNGDKVRINLPMMLIKMGVELGMQIPEFSGSEALRNLDVEQLLLMVEKGVIGKLVEVESANGDIVDIVVE